MQEKVSLHIRYLLTYLVSLSNNLIMDTHLFFIINIRKVSYVSIHHSIWFEKPFGFLR